MALKNKYCAAPQYCALCKEMLSNAEAIFSMFVRTTAILFGPKSKMSWAERMNWVNGESWSIRGKS